MKDEILEKNKKKIHEARSSEGHGKRVGKKKKKKEMIKLTK